MSNKFKFAAIGLISLFGLTACNDEIVAKPTGYDDQGILLKDDGSKADIYNNDMSVIFDKIRDGSIGSDVLNKVLYQYGISIFGAYNKKIEGVKDDTITLEDAFNDINADEQNNSYTSKNGVVNTFIKAHKAYWTVNLDGKRVDDNGQEVAGDADPSNSERARVYSKWNNINERIAKKMYNNIAGGSYSDRSLFYETRFLMSLRSSLKNVAAPAAGNVYDGVILDPDIEEVEVFDNFLHKENYTGEYTYIEDEIIPSLYNEMLVEQYILDEQYNALGRSSYARKVNIVSITTNDEYPLAARYLVNKFVERYISGEEAAPAGEKVDAHEAGDGLKMLKILSNAWKGADLTADEEALVVDSEGFVLKQIDDGNGGIESVYLGTEYGDMMEDYEKIADDPYLTDSSIESDFTSSNKYTKEVGKEIKEREIILKDHTKNGWFIKTGGLSDLPSSIRDRLFNVGVANALSEKAADSEEVLAQDRWQKGDAGWTYAKPQGESSYVSLINGYYYLKSSSSDSTLRDMVHYDSSSKTYYIVQIEEAASGSKLSRTNENNYANTRGDSVAEEFINEINEIVAQNDTYKTLSTKHWLEEALLKYHDDVVYDYFKSNYPELFEQLILTN